MPTVLKGTNDIGNESTPAQIVKTRLNPPSDGRRSWKQGNRPPTVARAVARSSDDRASQPSRATLATLADAAKQFSDGGLHELRRRFVAEGEYPAVLRLIDDEIESRSPLSPPSKR